MNERSVGSLTEERAAKYLTEQGITVLETNYRCPLGEADIVGKDTDGTIVFAEVKFRRSLSYGLPEEAVHATKQISIFFQSHIWCITSPYHLW